MGSGADWSEVRRFSLKTLRDIGFGKTSMEDLIQEEIATVCKKLEADQNSKGYVQMSQKFNIPVVSALWRIMTGEKIPHDHKKLVEITKRLAESADGNPVVFMIESSHPIYSKILSA